jgi:hypothetical protein
VHHELSNLETRSATQLHNSTDLPPPPSPLTRTGCELCSSRRNCSAFTYHPAGTHSPLECSLWEHAGKPHTSAGAVSAYIPETPTPPPPPSPPVTPPPIGPVNPPLGYQPNVVLIMTDDQDVELDSLKAMPKLLSLMGDNGATHRHWCDYRHCPLECPLVRANGLPHAIHFATPVLAAGQPTHLLTLMWPHPPARSHSLGHAHPLAHTHLGRLTHSLTLTWPHPPARSPLISVTLHSTTSVHK